ncbi:hypothetical protein [Bradyrhizobium elkanii]|jgi:hypothetical protein|uniref:Uncharacterized protein n=1 Tax=Bradyrhizobium elkanii TaxID=29448 RepID=A0ABV4F2J9_BRAEL|nr:hypothetical protein [Bradyrhizobium elkanii]MCS3449991.1 hypothetical protein [Bradyrhizobium elkanii]MCS3558864.1 hypothetical protein [Bradyrhizobium elkanii]MCS3890474.1 hypothetical protein [Bradyrhizobium elkanii]MCS4219926.1 hypothetical protein [Bradyrhizobium elkanii]MCW2151288.1 hypothetical protein [Bradyrhizobium elkanii]
MNKLATSYYSTAVGHGQVEGLYFGTFGIPGKPPMWVHDQHGQPKTFRDPDQACLAGFKVMVTQLNRARQEQDFRVKGAKNPMRSWTAPERSNANEPTIETVFGKKK